MRDKCTTNNDRIAADVAALSNTSRADLRLAWRRLYKAYPPKSLNRDLLELGVAWKIQERALGGHNAATKRQLDALADALDAKADITKARRIALRPGARLLREWRGETHEVVVLEDGFSWRGKHWRSLSFIAREITGTLFVGRSDSRPRWSLRRSHRAVMRRRLCLLCGSWSARNSGPSAWPR